MTNFIPQLLAAKKIIKWGLFLLLMDSKSPKYSFIITFYHLGWVSVVFLKLNYSAGPMSPPHVLMYLSEPMCKRVEIKQLLIVIFSDAFAGIQNTLKCYALTCLWMYLLKE